MADFQKEYEVIYLTGAPATGKSTLVRHLEEHASPLKAFTYSKVLAEFVSGSNNGGLAEDDLRRQSSGIIRPEDVRAVDAMLLAYVNENRSRTHIVIDSHAVTKERYGFRVTPFSLEQLNALRPTRICVLYTEAEVVRERIAASSLGRPQVTPFEADFHTDLQASVALIYGINLGIPVYFFDSSRPVLEIADEIKRLL
jgi:adenylate kinase